MAHTRDWLEWVRTIRLEQLVATAGVTYSNAMAASGFIKSTLQANQFNNQGTFYITWTRFGATWSDSELAAIFQQLP